MSDIGNPTGTCHVVLYAHAGTYGVDGIPTGPVLATSDGVDVSTLVYGLNTFTFTGAEQYTMSAGYYCILFENPTAGTIDTLNCPRVGHDRTTPMHGGNNIEYRNGGHISDPDRDVIFYVYGDTDCESITDPVECANSGCHWYNAGCHTDLPTCSQLDNEPDCTAYGCHWYNGACYSCEDFSDPYICESMGCFWYNDSCHSTPQPIEDDLVFIHHSCGQNWLVGNPPDFDCQPNCLHPALLTKDYIDERNDIYYGTVLPPDSGRPSSLGSIPGDYTHMEHWILWFNDYLNSIKNHDAATGVNRIIMYKSCYPNSNVTSTGTDGDPFSSERTVANYKAIYRHPNGSGNAYTYNGYTYWPLEDIFAANPDTLFINVTAPPLHQGTSTDPNAHRARLFNNWLKTDWLSNYNANNPGLNNVVIFDWFDFLAYPDNHTSHPNRLKTEYGGATGNSHPRTIANVESTNVFATNPANFIDTAWTAFITLPDCIDPPGYEGDQICGNPAYGQDPTHLYECQCSGGVCQWVDLGYSSICDVEEPCTNPPGVHGDIICGNPTYGQDPTHQYECIDGQWVDLGYNSGCDLEEPCTNPLGEHGDVICGNASYGQDPTHRYECIDGVWTDLGYSSDCDVTQPCANPPGVHGDIICGYPAYGQDPTHQYECIDGVWTDLGYSSDCDTQEPCVSPSGEHGDIICGDPAYGQDPTHRYQCVDGMWTDLGYSPDCDVPPPPQIPVWVWPLLFGGFVLGAIIVKGGEK